MKMFRGINDFVTNLFSTKSYQMKEKQSPNIADLCYELCLHLKYQQQRIEKLEEENVETTNTLYELIHTINALDARIDIVAEHNETQKNQMGCSKFEYDINGPHNF
jgi:hypothetical protein